jgi:hypothetical protein
VAAFSEEPYYDDKKNVEGKSIKQWSRWKKTPFMFI